MPPAAPADQPGRQPAAAAVPAHPSTDASAPAPSDSLTSAAAGLGQGGQGFDFFSSVVAGLVLGLGIDWLAGTRPWVTILGIVLGFVAGFAKLWAASAILVQQGEERRRG
ncbi:MAG: AtpZ/AtpI family protein [Acidimicrobiia bacterium]|nr:AtpZ/AtpI family protein [Acidimicrobiia bacterium]